MIEKLGSNMSKGTNYYEFLSHIPNIRITFTINLKWELHAGVKCFIHGKHHQMNGLESLNYLFRLILAKD